MGLIAHYRLDGSAEDAVGGNHGTVVGGVSWVDGKIGQCGNFDQTKISVGKPIPTNGSPFSISVWINPFSAMGSTHSSFINDGASKWDNGFTMYVRQSPGADLNVNFVTEDGRRFWGSGGTFNYDKFNHVVYTFDGKNGRTYVNGELAAVQGESLGTYNGGDLQIGYGVLGHWKGLIDDVRIYDHALSPREVRDLSLGLVSHFPMLKDEWGSHGTSSPVVVNAALLEEGGFEFTGSNSYIDLGSDQNFVGKADNSPLTVCAWIKPSAFSTRDMILSKNPNRSSSNYSYMFGLVSGNMNAYTGSTWRAFSTKGLISIGKWAHVAWVFDGTTLKGYVNGELVGSRSDFAYTNKEPSTVKIGGYHTSSDFHGTIKDHRVYSNPLTGEQIKELAQQRASIDSSGSLIARELFETGYKPPLGPSYDVWTAGTTGAEPGFTTNGSAAKSSRVIDDGPHGEQAVLWRATNTDTNSTNDGGWNSATFPIDNTKTYRFSVWMRRRVQGNGTGYWGCNGYGSTNGVLNLGALTNNTNPYFWSGSVNESWGWFLIVGHIHPAGYTGSMHPDSGRYTKDGYLGAISREFVWRPETTSVRHRSYLHYSTDLTTVQDMAYPRVDLCDGTEPTIQQLIDGFDLRWSQNNFPKQFAVQERLLLPSASEVGVARGLVAWYPLIGDTLDYSGARHAENSGAVARPDGYQFDGVDDSISSGDGADLYTKESITVTSIARPIGVDTSARTVVSFANNYSNTALCVDFWKGNLRFFTYKADGSSSLITYPYLIGELIQIAAVVSGTQNLLYVNGVLVGQIEVSGERLDLMPFWMGSRGSDRMFEGTIRDVRIYNRALEPEEVGLLHQMTSADGPKAAVSAGCLYTRGQLKEVIA